MHFITSCYGNQYSAILAVFLMSVHTNCSSSSVTIYWQDIDDDIIDALQTAFFKFHFIKTNFQINEYLHKRISSKMLLWSLALEESTEEEICLIDSDTVVQHAPENFIDDYDCIITDKNEQFHINTGVVLIKRTPAACEFLRTWAKRTIEIIENSSLLEEAIATSNHYGGADQMALYKIIEYTKIKKEYKYSTIKGDVFIKAIPCSILNETNSIPLSASTYIYHYKGGWRKILFDGEFSSLRTEKSCLQMYILYLRMFYAVISYLKIKKISNSVVEKFKLFIPSYFSMQDGTFSHFTWYKHRLFNFYNNVK